MSEGITRGMMIPFSIWRNRLPMNCTYIACLLLQVSFVSFSANPRPMPEKKWWFSFLSFQWSYTYQIGRQRRFRWSERCPWGSQNISPSYLQPWCCLTFPSESDSTVAKFLKKFNWEWGRTVEKSWYNLGKLRSQPLTLFCICRAGPTGEIIDDNEEDDFPIVSFDHHYV